MALDTEPAEIATLPAAEVELLLETIAEHKGFLDAAHEDVRRGVRPAYVIDFDLLYRFMYEPDDHADWRDELSYLLSHDDALYVIGPGTELEIASLGEQISAKPLDEQTRLRHQAEPLAELLRADNVMTYADVAPSVTGQDRGLAVDEDAYAVALATLDRARSGRSNERRNQADALNWAAVVHLRKHFRDQGSAFFPYLLTGTVPLLNEAAFDPQFKRPISRDPSTAIYTEVLLDGFPDASEAIDHTVKMSLLCAQLEHDLRSSPAYKDPHAFDFSPDWEKSLANGKIGPHLRDQVRSLTRFVDDPVVYMAQRIYDNAELTAEGLAQQGRGYRPLHVRESPRRLFDLIASLDAALTFGGNEARGLPDLWSAVLQLHVEPRNGYVVYELRDRVARGNKPPYFVVEVHAGLSESDEPTFVMNWPSGSDAGRVLDAFNAAFRRHDVEDVQLHAGTEEDVFSFAARIPLSIGEIADAVYAESSNTETRWFRIDAPSAFDLYADVATSTPRDPLVGVFAPSLHAAHVTDLYGKTSARFLFGAWLHRALLAINSEVGPGAAHRNLGSAEKRYHDAR